MSAEFSTFAFTPGFIIGFKFNIYSTMEKKDNLLEVIKTLLKWKKEIIYLCIIAGIGSIIISLLLPVYYKSTTVFLVSSSDRAKREILFNDGTLEGEYYGNENDIDRILTIAESNDLVDHLIDSFNLYEHYDINPDRPRSKYNIRRHFAKLYDVTKTKRDAIELSMEDTDKELAAKIANAARKGIDQIAQSLIKESQLEELKIYEADIKTKESQLAVLSDSLIRLRGQYGVYNSIVQTESLTAQFSQAESKLIRSEARLEALESTTGVNRDTIRYLKAAVKGMKQEVEKLNDKVVLFNEGMAIVNIYEEQYKLASETLGEVKELTKELKATYDSNIPAVLLVEEATTPVIKSRPKRSIVVIAAVFVAFLFGIIGILLLEAYRAIDWKELADAK
jgi:uncharacterized protein involved in exopolysaccharide biosynthesis